MKTPRPPTPTSGSAFHTLHATFRSLTHIECKCITLGHFPRSSRLEVSLVSIRGIPEGWALGYGQAKVASRNLHRYRHASFPCGGEAAYRFMVELGLPAPLTPWIDAFVAAHILGMRDGPQKHAR